MIHVLGETVVQVSDVVAYVRRELDDTPTLNIPLAPGIMLSMTLDDWARLQGNILDAIETPF